MSDVADIGSSESSRWMKIELRHLAAFQTLATELSFHGAAEELGYAQSAVSQQLFALERLVGSRLVDRRRGRRDVSLTGDGKLLLLHVQTIVAQLREARAELAELAEGRTGDLRVGVRSDLGPLLIPPLLDASAEQWPDISLEVSEAPSDEELFAGVESGRLDVCLTGSESSASGTAGEWLLRDDFVLLIPKTRLPPGQASPRPPGELITGDLILAEIEPEADELERRCRDWGVDDARLRRVPEIRIAVDLVVRGRGVALLSRHRLGTPPRGLVALGLANPLERRTLRLTHGPEDGRGPLLGKFRELAWRVAQDLGRTPSPELCRVLTSGRQPVL